MAYPLIYQCLAIVTGLTQGLQVIQTDKEIPIAVVWYDMIDDHGRSVLPGGCTPTAPGFRFQYLAA